MYLKADGVFCDGDFNHLERYLILLDTEFVPLYLKIKLSRDPESAGLCDYGEYIVGSAYAAVQRYFSSTYPQSNIGRDEALSLGSVIAGNLTFAQAVNAGANFWKHMEEWGLTNVVHRDINGLKGSAKKTIETIEKATPWSDYTCANLLAVILKEQELQFQALLPYIQDWRIAVDSYAAIKVA